MAKEAFRAVVCILAIIYNLFFLVSLVRTYQAKNFSSLWKGARLLFIFLSIQTACRSISSWLLAMDAEEHNILKDLYINSIILSAPEALFIAGYMVLLWIVVSESYNTRLATHDLINDSIINPLLIKLGRFIQAGISVWLAAMTSLYVLCVFTIIDTMILNYIFLGANVAITLGVMLAYIILQVKFSGVPFKTLIDESNSRKVFLVTIVWTAGRSLHTLVFILDRFNLLSVSEEIAGLQDNGIYKTLVYMSDIILTEMLCIYLVLESSFYRIFIAQTPILDNLMPLVESSSHAPRPNDIETQEQMRRQSYSMEIPVNPELKLELLETVEALRVQKCKLGQLYLGKYNQKPVVFRQITFSRFNRYLGEGILKDIEDLKQIKSRYLSPILGACIHLPYVDLVMPYRPNGSLYSALHERNVLFSHAHRLRIARELALGMKEIHSQGEVHGHLSSHNILLGTEWSVQITDLGMHYLKKFSSVNLKYSRKSAWSSPEVLREPSKFGSKVSISDDVYSYGMILWELFSGKEPFPNCRMADLKKMVNDGYRPNIPEEVDEGIRHLIKSCWNVDPLSRPEFRLIYSTICMIGVR